MGRFRCDVEVDGAATVLWTVAQDVADARGQLDRDHRRGATLAYRSGEHAEYEARIDWHNVETLVVLQVEKTEDYWPQ